MGKRDSQNSKGAPAAAFAPIHRRAHVAAIVRRRLSPATRPALSVLLLAAAALLLTAAPALAFGPGISTAYGEPYIQVEEFSPGASAVSADFYAFVESLTPANARFQYVDSAGYEPGEPEPYAAGTTVTLATGFTGTIEPHLHLSLAPDTTYYWRLLATNAEGTTPREATLNTYAPSQPPLPDTRAYEQVSPSDKNHVDAEGIDRGSPSMQASPSGSAFAYFSFLPFPQASANGAFFTEYLSARSSSPPAWLTQGLQAPLEPTANDIDNVAGFTPDLARAVLQVQGPPLAPPGVVDAFLRDSATGDLHLLAAGVGSAALIFVAASADDSRILFETETKLLPEATAGFTNLYLWDESKPEAQRLSLAGVLPDAECEALAESPGCASPHGSNASPGTDLGSASQHQSYSKEPYSQALGAFSADGSRIFFAAEGRLYERLPAAEETVPLAPGPATFLAATPDGRYVFYSEAGELYRFDTESETRQALTAGAEGVRGSLGVSADGSTAYFVAPGVLAANQNASGETAESGSDNLYSWHRGATAFLARLAPRDAGDWGQLAEGEGRSSRLNPAGTALLFASAASLTGYGNAGRVELFLYDAAAVDGEGALTCVSCNPSGAAPELSPNLSQGNVHLALPGPTWTPHLPRNLSADGSRVFFETEEALLPADTNDAGDVYEWERPGVASCAESSPSYFSSDAGCIFLLSTGTAHASSFFGDASESGDDAFFFTRQPLVGQDRDLNYDVYDARVNGGIASQNPPVNPACEAEAACKPHQFEPPAQPSPASEQFVGPPNPTYCPRGFLFKNGKCVMKHARARKHGKPHKAKQHHAGGR